MEPKMNGAYGTMYYVRDMKKAVDYYKNIFGLKPRFESQEWTEFDVAGHGLCLHAMVKEAKSVHGGILITKVKEIKKLIEELKRAGVEFNGTVKEVHPGAWSADFIDPSGNVLSLYDDTNTYR